MENRKINIAVVAEVAQALKELKDQMVFVGGAVVSLYTDDPAIFALASNSTEKSRLSL